ncbi:E3 ubiquitin-protein ligase ATL41-like [Tasmannia lanceolata]|uniref:E3 ubiquitin-protein ligase ATL41-like n=1 Tax=Tasmannia lanceolata TaxID=3420 RepID=UPI0040640D25
MSDNNGFSGDDQGKNQYGISSKILLASITCLFFVVVVVVILHIHARIVLQRQARRRATLLQMSLGVTVTHTHGVQPMTGLDPSVIEKLPMFIYKRTDESGVECAVCLGALEENEMVKVLPNCKHTFHVQCIDMWLDSHSTCPICRSGAEPRGEVESGESTTVSASAPPLDLGMSSEGTSDTPEQSSKVGGSGIRSSFRRMISLTRERSGRRVQTCGQGDALEDLERQ